MKIVVTGTRGIPNIMGGVETHCEELFPRIAGMGFDVTVIRRKSYVHDSLKEYKGVKLIDIATPKKKSFEAIIHTFRAILKAKSLHADIVHIHAIGPALLTPLARLLGMKVVFTHHGPDYDRDKWGFAAKTMLKLGERMGTKYANEVIVISEVINDILVRKYNRRDCHLIYNGVPKPDLCDYPEYFEELGIEKGKYGHLKQMAKKNGVVLTGFIKGKKLHSLLTHTRCFVLPSSHEGLPIALLEAMSYGCPVIVSNIPANLEVGLDYESYFPVGDVDALARKLQENIEKPYRKVHYDMAEYDWNHIAQQVAEVYNKIVSVQN